MTEKIKLPDWVKYVEGDKKNPGLYDLISDYLDKHVDKDVTNFLQVAYGFFAFYTEHLNTKITKNREHWDDANVFLIYVHDCMRALITLHRFRHMSPMAFTVRSILESRITANYIFMDPKVRFDLYIRYENIEKYSAFIKGTNKEITSAKAEEIKAKNPEWFYEKDGEICTRHYWTVKRITLRDMADDVGLLDLYESTYSQTSIYSHCSSIVKNAYRGKDGLSPIPINDQTTYLALTGAVFGLKFLSEIYDFFGIEFPHDQKAVVDLLMIKLSKYSGTTTKDLEELLRKATEEASPVKE